MARSRAGLSSHTVQFRVPNIPSPQFLVYFSLEFKINLSPILRQISSNKSRVFTVINISNILRQKSLQNYFKDTCPEI